MKIIKLIFNFGISLIFGFAVLVAVAQKLNEVVWPSLMVAIPAGIIVFAASFLLIKKGLKYF